MITKGAILAFASRPYEGIGILEAGIRLAEAHGLQDTVVRGLLNLGVAPSAAIHECLRPQPRGVGPRERGSGSRSSYATALGNAAEPPCDLGEWDWALAATDDVNVGHLAPADRASVFRPRAEILAARGEPVDDLLAEHERLIAERDDAQQESNLLAGKAAAAFAEGRYREASAAWHRSAELNATNAATDFPRSARAALWEGDLQGVRAALGALDAGAVHGRVVDLERRAFRAALSAHDGDLEHAAREYAAVLPELVEMGLAYKQALVVLDMALVLGPDDSVVQANVDDARAILERLGARAFSARLDELMGEAADARTGGSSAHAPEVPRSPRTPNAASSATTNTAGGRRASSTSRAAATRRRSASRRCTSPTSSRRPGASGRCSRTSTWSGHA